MIHAHITLLDADGAIREVARPFWPCRHGLEARATTLKPTPVTDRLPQFSTDEIRDTHDEMNG